jgi:hypothetical protein
MRGNTSGEPSCLQSSASARSLSPLLATSDSLTENMTTALYLRSVHSSQKVYAFCKILNETIENTKIGEKTYL